MLLARRAPRSPEQTSTFVAALVAAVASLSVAAIATILGPQVAALVLLVPASLVVLVIAFLRVPHVAVAVSIGFLMVLPAAKFFVAGWLGGLKEVLLVSAVIAASVAAVRGRARGADTHVDRMLLLTVIGFLFILALNVSGSHDAAWSNSFRLTATPLIWMLVGYSLEGSTRTFRWAGLGLVVSACVVAVVGLAQQAIGPQGLVDLGYRWNIDVRTVEGQFRSFGTLDEAFQYAAVLLLALGVVMNSKLVGRARWPILALLLAGTAASFVRTAAVIALALCVLVAIRHRHRGLAGLLVVLSAASAVIFLGPAGGQPVERKPLQDRTATLGTLNGRTAVWADAIGSPSALFAGRGVGTFASQSLGPNSAAQAATASDAASTAYADSSYVATLASAGIPGLVLLVALLARLVSLVRSAIRAVPSIGWVLAATLVVLLVDALTRDSLWGVPNATIGFLLIGLGLRATADRMRGTGT